MVGGWVGGWLVVGCCCLVDWLVVFKHNLLLQRLLVVHSIV